MANKNVYPFGPDGVLPSSIGLVHNTTTGGADKALGADVGESLGDFLFGKETPVALYELTESTYALGDPKWYGTNGRHIVIPVTPGERYRIAVKESTTDTNYYGFLTSSYVVPTSQNDVVPYVTGTSRITLEAEAETMVTIPTGAAYLCICTANTSGTGASWYVAEFEQDETNTFRDTIEQNKERTFTYLLGLIDLSTLTSHSGTLGAKSAGGKWYIANGSSHLAIPVNGGDELQLQCDSDHGYYGFVTSSYTPPSSSQDLVPYCFDTDRMTLTDEDGAVGVVAPPDAAYLIICTKDGGGNSAVWTVWNKTIITVDEAFREHCVHIGEGEGGQARLKFVSWNVGGFSLGTSGTPTITPETLDAMKAKWRVALNDLGADVLLCCEYNTNFMEAQGGSSAVDAREAVFTDDIFFDAKIGPEVSNLYMQTAVFANLPLLASTIVYYDTTIQSYRYYQAVDVNIGGKSVKLVAVHLDFSTADSESNAGTIARRAQIAQLISDFSSYDYVIFAGDFNTNYSFVTDFDLFAQAGYKMVNHGYLGNIVTYPAGNSPTDVLDNIVFKGFAASKVGTFNDNTLSDHMAIFADLTIVPNIESEDESE